MSIVDGGPHRIPTGTSGSDAVRGAAHRIRSGDASAVAACDKGPGATGTNPGPFLRGATPLIDIRCGDAKGGDSS